MHKYPVNSLKIVPMGDIEATDRKFAVSPPWSVCPPFLEYSIGAVGVLNPLRLEQLPTYFRIVCGFRRFLAAKAAGIEEVPAIIISSQQGLENFLLALWENLGTRPLSALETATVLHKLKTCYRIPEERLLSEFMGPLRLKPSRYVLRTQLDLVALGESLQRAVDQGPLLFETALRISGWSNDEQEFFVGLVEQYQLGRNKQRQILELLFDLRRAHQVDVREIWKRSGAEAIREDGNLPPEQVFHRTRAALRKLRYPHITAHEETFQRLRKELDLPGKIRLRPPPNFEGEGISVSFEARSPGEFRNLVSGLGQSSGRDQLDEIFELL